MPYIIINSQADEKIFYSAENLGFTVVVADNVPGINPSVSFHPDMHIAKIDDILVISPENFSYYSEKLKNVNLICGSKSVSGKYPEYIAYNIAIAGEVAIHNFDYTDDKILNIIKNKKLVNVRQGYAKCSCVLAEDTVITSDEGIISACKKADVPSVYVPAGHVTLTGLEYGFLGGASGYYNGVLYFTGDIALHPGYEEIKKLCKTKGIEIVCMSNDKLADIGSIIMI